MPPPLSWQAGGDDEDLMLQQALQASIVTYQQECTGTTPQPPQQQQQQGNAPALTAKKQQQQGDTATRDDSQRVDHGMYGSDPAAVSAGLDFSMGGAEEGVEQGGQQQQQQPDGAITPKAAAVPAVLDLSDGPHAVQWKSWQQPSHEQNAAAKDEANKLVIQIPSPSVPSPVAGGAGGGLLMTEQEQLDRALQESLRDFQQTKQLGETAGVAVAGLPAVGGDDAYDEEAALMKAIAESEALHREQLERRGQGQQQGDGANVQQQQQQQCNGSAPMEVDEAAAGQPAAATAKCDPAAADGSGGDSSAAAEEEDVVVLTNGLQQPDQEGAAAAGQPSLPARRHVSEGSWNRARG
jgi:hypothetical protein